MVNIFRWFCKNSHTITFQKWRSVFPVKYKIQLIYTMIKRLKYICSTEKRLYKDLECLKESFRYSEYFEHIITKHFFRAMSYKQNKILYKFQRNQFILDYNILTRKLRLLLIE